MSISKSRVKSLSPQALSVVALTVLDDPVATAFKITEFDDKDFGFNHSQTWNNLPLALKGQFSREGIERQFAASSKKINSRIIKCVAALYGLGEQSPKSTFSFKDYPDSHLRTHVPLEFGHINILAKATCWYVENDRIKIPVLQPRLSGLDATKLGIYKKLVELAYCRDVWRNADIEIIDLSGLRNEPVEARFISSDQIVEATETDAANFVRHYLEGLQLAHKLREGAPVKATSKPLEAALFEFK